MDWRSGGSAVDTRDSGLSPIEQRLEVGGDGASGAQAVQSSDSLAVDLPVGRAAALAVSSLHSEPLPGQESFVPESMNSSLNNHAHKVFFSSQLMFFSVLYSEISFRCLQIFVSC